MMNLTLRFLMVLPGLCVAAVKENIAVGSKAVQSSTYNHLANAANAIDGNRNSVYSSGSCTHTMTEKNPWWRVQFSTPHYITSVTITNRGDCCHERIEGAQIRIGNDEENNGNNNQLVGIVQSLGAGETKSFKFRPVVGQFVNVVIPGNLKILTLCEVEVYTGEQFSYNTMEEKDKITKNRNLALGGRATQSSLQISGTLAGLGIAKNAIDGNRNPDLMKGSCTLTAQESSPWWRVNLHRTYAITSVALTNRGDCCPEGLNGAEIWIGNSLKNDGKNNTLCATVSFIPAGQTEYLHCGWIVEGRYVTIVLQREGVLSLCEVEVFGTVIKSVDDKDHNDDDDEEYVSENIAFGSKAVQSSTNNYYLAHAAKAIDGNRNSNYFDGSCTHTFPEKSPWWRVEFSRSHYITSVTITNRGDCCHERIEGAQIRIGNNEENNGNNNQLVGIVHSLGLGKTKSFTFRPFKGRFVNIVIPGELKTLTLCEVEVHTGEQFIVNTMGGRATQSSLQISGTLAGLGLPQNAIDGNRSPDLMKGSCTLTAQESSPWWRVNLHRTYAITSVALTNRGDCCPEGLNGAEIRIGNSLKNDGKNNTLCTTVSFIPAGETEYFYCDRAMEGRYVTIVLQREGVLSLCEVEVFGTLAKSVDNLDDDDDDDDDE